MGLSEGRTWRGMWRRVVLVSVVFLAISTATVSAWSDDAPSAPGTASDWASAAKEFLGTSLTEKSRVYFSGAQGIVTEVFYPTIDTVQNVDLEFLVTDTARSWGPEFGEEKRQRQHDISLIDKRAMAWKVVTTADNNAWTITKVIFTDPERSALVIRATFESLQPGKTVHDYNVFVLNNPAINNSGGGDGFTAGNDNSRTLQSDGRLMTCASEPFSTSSALACGKPWKTVGGNAMLSNGFVGRNDGWSDLFSGSSDKTMDWHFDAAMGGNVAQMGWIDFGNESGRSISFDIVLAFGGSEADAMAVANATLGSNLNDVQASYIHGWSTYTNGLDNQDGRADDQYYLAAMTLKSCQDKSNGAMVAGPGTPWGENENDGNSGGYHLVWARDLFKFASALLTAGDKDSVRKAVDFLFNVQMQMVDRGDPGNIDYSKAGRFPQNTYIDGRPYWNGTQMDETAMPVILVWKLHQVAPLDLHAMWPKIKLAAEYLARNGPRTEQDRWEEMSGYSPSTIAAEIAGLVCAADLARAANDADAAAFYLRKADEWRNNIANWTFTTTGFHGNKKYYIRITANDDPDDDVQLAFKNNAGTHGERYIIDGGFLELARMGVLSPNDWTVRETLPEYDSILKRTLVGKGDLFFRYNYDGYGEQNDGQYFNAGNRGGRGRLWPIFTAERGIYEISSSGDGTKGTQYLNTLKAISSPVGFIPEQVWNESTSITGWQTDTQINDQPGTATRSMRPLNWAMGEYINLIAAMRAGRNDAPAAVVRRYATDRSQITVTFRVRAETQFGQNIFLVGNHALLSEFVPEAGIKLSPVAYPIWSVTLSLPASTTFEYKYVRRDAQGNSSFEGGANRNFITPPPSSNATMINDQFN